jgi:hypothetical protein
LRLQVEDLTESRHAFHVANFPHILAIIGLGYFLERKG